MKKFFSRLCKRTEEEEGDTLAPMMNAMSRDRSMRQKILLINKELQVVKKFIESNKGGTNIDNVLDNIKEINSQLYEIYTQEWY